jgi:hypothetical protein
MVYIFSCGFCTDDKYTDNLDDEYERDATLGPDIHVSISSEVLGFSLKQQPPCCLMELLLTHYKALDCCFAGLSWFPGHDPTDGPVPTGLHVTLQTFRLLG